MTHLKKHPVNTSVSKKDPKTKSEFKTDIENGSSESVRFGKLAETSKLCFSSGQIILVHFSSVCPTVNLGPTCSAFGLDFRHAHKSMAY